MWKQSSFAFLKKLGVPWKQTQLYNPKKRNQYPILLKNQKDLVINAKNKIKIVTNPTLHIIIDLSILSLYVGTKMSFYITKRSDRTMMHWIKLHNNQTFIQLVQQLAIMWP